MPILDPKRLRVLERPEIVVGLVAAVGAPVSHVQQLIISDLEQRGYTVEPIWMSKLIGLVEDPGEPHPAPSSEYERIKTLMTRGSELRKRTKSGDVLALLAAAEIHRRRPAGRLPVLDGQAFILRQLKHPDEVKALRLIYGDAFHLVGVSSPESARRRNLIVTYGMTEQQAEDLIDTDQGEDERLGQQLRDTFHLADVFIPVYDQDDAPVADREIRRYLSLIFTDCRQGIATPTVDEHGMLLAAAAALRSADLSRQVGAAIVRPDGEVVALGCNEVPAAGGGQYWSGAEPDGRDFALGYDSNAVKRLQVLEEVVAVVDSGFSALPHADKEARLSELSKKLGPTRLMNLTEFGRAVHAEMAALMAAARANISVHGNTLYTTTFPCHNCAKHLVAAGISRVIYVEPYPKSLTQELHNDSIRLVDEEEGPDNDDGRVALVSFVGVSPRRYVSLFSMVSREGVRHVRKGADGKFLAEISGLRVTGPVLNYVERESEAAAALRDFIASDQQGELELG